MPFQRFMRQNKGGRNVSTRQFVKEAIHGPDPEDDTPEAREQQEEIKLAHARAADIKEAEETLERLRASQHEFIIRARTGADGWRRIGPTLLSEIVGISRQRIGEIVGVPDDED